MRRYSVVSLGSQFIKAPTGGLDDYRTRWGAKRAMWQFKSYTPYMDFAVVDHDGQSLLAATCDLSKVKSRSV